MTWINLALGSLWGIAALQLVFVVVVGKWTVWHSRIVTRALYVKSSVLLLTVLNSLVNYYWPLPNQLAVSALLLFMLLLAVAYQDVAVLHELFWRDPKRKPTGR